MLKRISVAAMLGLSVILGLSCGGEGREEATSTASAALTPAPLSPSGPAPLHRWFQPPSPPPGRR